MPPRQHPDLVVLVCVEQSQLRDQVREELTEKSLGSIPAPYQILAVQYLRIGDVLERLQSLFGEAEGCGVVVVSEMLAEESRPGQLAPTAAATELLDLFQDRLYATVALAEVAGSVADVDRVVPINEIPARLRNAVRLCFDRLAYLRPPSRAGGVNGDNIAVREIRSEEELRAYFRLRFNTYRAMCYLDPLVEQNRLGMEIDWFDTRAYHFGAYVQQDGYQELVATARLIISTPTDEARQQPVRQIVNQDPILRQFVEDGAIQALLPVLQSQRLTPVLDSVARTNGVVGELSRVIVSSKYRGRGLSARMAEEVVAAARRNNVSDLLLECLPIHRTLYERTDFTLVPGLRGNVYLINRNMIVMHRPLAKTSAFPTPPTKPQRRAKRQ